MAWKPQVWHSTCRGWPFSHITLWAYSWFIPLLQGCGARKGKVNCSRTVRREGKNSISFFPSSFWRAVGLCYYLINSIIAFFNQHLNFFLGRYIMPQGDFRVPLSSKGLKLAELQHLFYWSSLGLCLEQSTTPLQHVSLRHQAGGWREQLPLPQPFEGFCIECCHEVIEILYK